MNTAVEAVPYDQGRRNTSRTRGRATHPGRAARRAYLEGARAMLPWLVGVVPFGLMIGVTSAARGHPTGFGLATGMLIYAGSAQVTAIELVADGAALGVVVVSVLMINARLLMYGSSMARHWSGTPLRFRMLAAYLLIDPSFAEGERRYRTDPACGHWFYIGTATTLWLAWQFAIVVGSVGGNVVPESAGLEHIVPLYLLAELSSVVRGRPMFGAAIAGAVASLFAVDFPMHSGLLVAIAAGVTVGARLDGGRS